VTILEEVDRLGKARSASGNSSMRDGRDDTFGHSYGGALLQSKEVEGDTGAEEVPGHLGKTTVPIVPATRAHTTSGKIACQPAARIKDRAGFWSLDDALDPYELHDIVCMEGVRTAVAMLKRIGIQNANAYAIDAQWTRIKRRTPHDIFDYRVCTAQLSPAPFDLFAASYPLYRI
jgi:hypothetical protein